MDGWMDGCFQMYGCIQMYVCMYGWMDGCIDSVYIACISRVYRVYIYIHTRIQTNTGIPYIIYIYIERESMVIWHDYMIYIICKVSTLYVRLRIWYEDVRYTLQTCNVPHIFTCVVPLIKRSNCIIAKGLDQWVQMQVRSHIDQDGGLCH